MMQRPWVFVRVGIPIAPSQTKNFVNFCFCAHVDCLVTYRFVMRRKVSKVASNEIDGKVSAIGHKEDVREREDVVQKYKEDPDS